ncbi:MAG: redoxin domain-containing protein [Pirellulaceae bacterium]
MNKRIFLLAIAAIAAMLGNLSPTFGNNDDLLTIGSKAPNLDIEHWVQNGNGKYKQVTEFAAGKVYVVEFWATWCGPCIASMPHIAETQQKYGDSVQVVSVSDEDLETVEAFLEKKVRGSSDEDKKTYKDLTSVYCLTTDPDNSTHKDYMEAAHQNGIPTCFIVGKDGVIEWIGHPMEMDEPLEMVLDDKWDREAAVAEMKKQQALQERLMKLGMLMQSEKFDDALALIDEVIAGSSDADEAVMYKGFRFQILMEAKRFDVAADSLKEFANSASATPDMLNSLAWGVFETATSIDDVEKELIESALQAAQKAVAGEPENGMYLDTLAHLQHITGDLDGAIATQEKAVKNPGPAKAEIEAFLEDLKKEKADK